MDKNLRSIFFLMAGALKNGSINRHNNVGQNFGCLVNAATEAYLALVYFYELINLVAYEIFKL